MSVQYPYLPTLADAATILNIACAPDTDPAAVAADVMRVRSLLASAAEEILRGSPTYVVKAVTYSGQKAADLTRIETVIPYCPTAEPLPVSLTPHTCYSVAGLTYALPVNGWREMLAALRARHPAVPLAVVKDGSVRPIPEATRERATVEPCADFLIKCNATADYPHTIEIEWYTEAAPGVVLRIHATAGEMTGPTSYHPLTRRVRYTLDNPPRSERDRQHPEDRRWSCSWAWGDGSRSIRWWTSPGNRAPHTWTWATGVTLDHAIGEE